MAFQLEHIAKAVKTRLESSLPSALSTVEASWAGSDPITIPDPVTWFYGHKPTVLEMESAEFPFVSVIPVGRDKVREVYGWGYQNQNPRVYVDWFIVADDETTADKLCSRYAEAMGKVTQMQRSYAGYDQEDFEPQIDLSEASRHPKTHDADMLEDAHVDFIKMGRMTLEFGGG